MLTPAPLVTRATPSTPSYALPTLFRFPARISSQLAVMGLAFEAPTAWAAQASPVIEPAGGLLQVLFGLLLVAVLLAGSLYLLKRLGAPQGGRNSVLRVISATPVGPRERIVVVEAGSSWLVLGVTAGQISKLHELPRPSNDEAPSSSPSSPPLPDFAARLRSILEKRHAS